MPKNDTTHTLVVGMMQPPTTACLSRAAACIPLREYHPRCIHKGVIKRLRYLWSCEHVRTISPTTPIFAHITE